MWLQKERNPWKKFAHKKQLFLVTVVVTYGENIIWFRIYWPFAHSSASLRRRTYKRTLYKVNNYPDSSESFPLFLGVFTLHELASDTCEYRLLQRVLYTLNNCFWFVKLFRIRSNTTFSSYSVWQLHTRQPCAAVAARVPAHKFARHNSTTPSTWHI